MALFDDYDYCHANMPWKAGVAGLNSLTVGCEDFRTRNIVNALYKHFDYSVHCVFGGQGRMFYRDTAYDIHAGDMFCVLPNREIRYQADKKNPWCYCWFGFAGESAPLFAASLGFTQLSSLVRPIKNTAACKRLFKNRLDITQKLAALQLDTTTYIYGLTADFFSFLELESITKTLDDTLQQERSVEYLEELISTRHHDKSFSFSDAYLQFHMTSGLRAQFTKRYGMPPVAYLTAVRMRHAAELLAKGVKSLTVHEIANLCGYSNPSHFMRVFKETFGFTAMDYRRKENWR